MDCIRVLLVDPETDRRDRTVRELEDEGIRVTSVRSSDDAVAKLSEEPIDCVVSTFELPGGNALSLLDRVREIDSGISFVLFAEDLSTEHVDEALAAGVTDYVPNTERAHTLLADRIESHVDSSSDGASSERSSSDESPSKGSSSGTTRRPYQAFIDNVPGIVYRSRVDPGWPFEFVAGNCRTVTGYSCEKLENDVNWGLAVLHPDDRADVYETIVEAIGNDEQFEITYRIFTRDGDLRWVWERGWEGDDSGDVVEGFIVDVTERKRRERALERERERFADLFSNFPEPTVAYGFEDGTTVFRTVNDAFESVFGLDEESIRGESVNELIVPDGHRSESDNIDRKVHSGDMVDRTVHRTAADGVRIFNLRSIPVEAGGDIDGFAVYADVTEQKEQERELKRQNERLEEFASIVSHDLRNPLNVAMGHLEIVGDECDHPSVDNVSDALARMETLIHETLQLARQGRTVTETKPIQLSELLDSCWEMIESEDATLSRDGDVRFRGDPSRVRQLFENLFRNAIEHGGEDVAIRVGVDDGTLFVEDDGPGIPEDERDAVFEPGYSSTEDGTGFGLAIVHGIVEAHDWEISVTGSSEGGARFEITGFERTDGT